MPQPTKCFYVRVCLLEPAHGLCHTTCPLTARASVHTVVCPERQASTTLRRRHLRRRLQPRHKPVSLHTAPLILCAHVIPRTRARHVPAPQQRVGNKCVRPCFPFGTVRARPTSPHSHVGACIDSVCLHRDLDHTSAFALKHFTLSTEGFRVGASGLYSTRYFATRLVHRPPRAIPCLLFACRALL